MSVWTNWLNVDFRQSVNLPVFFFCFRHFAITCSFLGREYEYLQTPKAAEDDSETDQSGNSAEDDDEADADDASNAAEEEDNAEDEDADANNEEDDEEEEDDRDEEDDDSDSTAEQDQDQDHEPEAEADNEDEDVDEAVSAPESDNEKENTPSIFSGAPAAQSQGDGKNPALAEDNASTGKD